MSPHIAYGLPAGAIIVVSVAIAAYDNLWFPVMNGIVGGFIGGLWFAEVVRAAVRGR